MVEEYSGTSTTPSARYDYGDDLVRMDRGGIYYYIYDGLGSTRQLVNTSGTVTDSYGYSAFGEMASHTGTTANPFLFNAQQFDSASGDYYLRARYYDQGNGRFISQDPYAGDNEDPISLHRYLYASSNPVNRVDPSGQDDTLFGLSVTLGVQQTIAAAFVGAAGFAVATSAQGGSVGQVLQSTLYGAEAGFALAVAATKEDLLTTIVSGVFGGLASLTLKAILQPVLKPGTPLSSLDASLAFEGGFASSALSSAFKGSYSFKAKLSFSIALGDDLLTYLRKDIEANPQTLNDFPAQIGYSLVDATISAGLAGLKQTLVDEYADPANYPGSTAQLFSGLSDKAFTKIVLDAVQKISSVYLKSIIKPLGHSLNGSIN